VEVLKRGLIADGENRYIYNALGFFYASLYQYNEALAAHQHYVALAANEPNAHDSLGITYQQLGQYQQAINEYNQAIALNPKFHFANLHLADLYFQIGRYKDALRQYHKYIEIAPSIRDRAVGYERIGLLYLKKNDLNNAIAAAEQELSYDENFVDTYFI